MKSWSARWSAASLLRQGFGGQAERAGSDRWRAQRVRRKRSTYALLAWLAAGALRAADSSTITAPAQNWVLPLFSPSGYRSLTLRGHEARLTAKDRIDVTEINITVFSGDAATKVTTSVLSSQATYFPSRQFASGPGSVRIIRAADNTEASGEDWSYDFAHEKVSIHRQVRVVFHQALHDFLK